MVPSQPDATVHLLQPCQAMLLLPSKQWVLLKHLMNMNVAVSAWTQSPPHLYTGCCKAPEFPLSKDLTMTPVAWVKAHLSFQADKKDS